MEKKIINELEEFLTKEIDKEYLARYIRRFMHETIKMTFIAEEKDHFIDKDWLSDGYYFLTELCEILDPQLKSK